MKIKSGELSTLNSCTKKFEIKSKKLKQENEQYLYLGLAINYMSDLIAQKKNIDEIKKELISFLGEHYKKEWFPLNWMLEHTVQHDLEQLLRLVHWFPHYGEPMEANKKFLINHRFQLKGFNIKEVEVKSNIILETSTKVIGMIIKRKFPKEYSYAARKNENKVLSNVQLQYLLIALKEHYPKKDIEVVFIQLKSKQDKNRKLAEFDQKKGDNLISYSYEEYVKKKGENIYDNIIEDLKQESPLLCKECFYEVLCKYNIVTKDTKTAVKSAEKKKLEFSKNQNKIIMEWKGPMRVIAGPGAGKTATLVKRIQTMLEQGVLANQILAITFTKKAAREMKARLYVDDIYISTIHSLALDLLQKYFNAKISLMTKVNQKQIILQLLNICPIIRNVSYEGLFMPYGLIETILNDFEFIEKFGVEKFIDSFPKKDAANLFKIRDLYNQIVETNHYVTYDDLLKMVVKELKEKKAIRKQLQKTFPYMLVDETQDIDVMQMEFIQLMAGAVPNLLICGDVDQNIYGFRGGTNEFMMNFDKIYPTSTSIILDDNYRSTKEIVDATQKMIRNNTQRIATEFFASRSGKRGVHINRFNKQRIGELIMNICENGYQYGDIAIIARTNKDLIDCSSVFLSKFPAIPVEHAKYYLREDFVYLTFLNIFSLYIKEMGDDKALYWILNNYKCSFSKECKDKSIYENLLDAGLIYDFYEEGSNYSLIKDIDNTNMILKTFAKIYHCFTLLSLPIEEAIERISEYLFTEKIDYTTVVDKITDLIKERQIESVGELYQLLKSIQVFKDDTKVDYDMRDKNMVHMSTSHDAKGMEFPIVIIYGIDQFEKEGSEEERRILYVAITRAKEQFYTIEIVPGKSNFLKELEIDYYEGGRYE